MTAPTPPPISFRINAERLVVLGWTRAILMQFAHPLIAAGVDAHSTFQRHTWSPLARLHHTVRAMLALTFGADAERDRAIDGILAIHRRVHGHLDVSTGRYPAGTPYSAEDPALVLWVHATLMESIPLVYDMLVAPLDVADRDLYCAQAAPVAIALGAVPADVPRTWSSVRECLERGYATRSVAVGDRARRLGAAVLAPPFARAVPPLAWMNRVLALGLLPPHLREEYGFAWRPRDQRAFDTIVTQIRRLRPVLPDRLAMWPEGRRAIAP